MTGPAAARRRGDAPLAKHTHAVFDLDDGRQLRYRDPRRFGRLLLGTRGGAAGRRRRCRASAPSRSTPTSPPTSCTGGCASAAGAAESRAARPVARSRASATSTPTSRCTARACGPTGSRARCQPKVRAQAARVAARIARARDRESRQLGRHVSRRVGRDRRPAGEAAASTVAPASRASRAAGRCALIRIAGRTTVFCRRCQR